MKQTKEMENKLLYNKRNKKFLFGKIIIPKFMKKKKEKNYIEQNPKSYTNKNYYKKRKKNMRN